jgi:kynureninase
MTLEQQREQPRDSPDEGDDWLLEWRGHFPILGTTLYLISNSLGAVPATAEQGLRDYYNCWATRGVRAWEDAWWTMAADLGDLVAPLIGAKPGETVFQPNVTIAHAVVFSALDQHGERTKIVTDAMHFPSILYILREKERDGASVVVVPSADGIGVDTERLIAAIDETTSYVSISHVLFKSAYIHDVGAIAERARRVGALLVVDGYQSIGVIPVDVHALGADVYIGGCLKWLCGGPGAAFLWVDPEVGKRLRPRMTGCMSHEQPFSFEPVLQRRRDAWRFLHGTPAISALYAARPGLEIIGRIGAVAIRNKSLRQTARLIDLVEARGYRCNVPRDPARRGGTVAIDLEHGYEISRALKAVDILCDYRKGAGIRFSPHFYTRDDELECAIDATAEIVRTGAWRAYSESRSAVT